MESICQEYSKLIKVFEESYRLIKERYLTLIGLLDDLGGAFLGSLICGFMLSFLFNILDWLNIELLSNEINNSILYPIIKEIQPILTEYILLAINIAPEFWDLIKNIEENKSFT